MADYAKVKRKIYFTVGGLGYKSGLDPAVKIGVSKFNKRTANKSSQPGNFIFNEKTRDIGSKKIATK